MKKLLVVRFSLLGLMVGMATSFAQLPTTFKYKDRFTQWWNHHDLTEFMEHSSNWKIKYPDTDSATIYTDGLSHPGGMTHLIYKFRVANNIEWRATVRMPKIGGANSGMQFRSRCESATGTLLNNCSGTPWVACGPQADLGDSYSGDIYNGCSGAYINQQTVTSFPNKVNTISTCRAASNFTDVTQWHEMKIRIFNDTAYTYINGKVCSHYLLTAASDKQATTQGLLSLQYESQMIVEFRKLELKNLDGIDSVPTNTMKRLDAANLAYQLKGEKSFISFAIPEAGPFFVQVRDLHGKVVKTLQGVGPSSHSLSLGGSGLFFVKIESGLGTQLKKILVD